MLRATRGMRRLAATVRAASSSGLVGARAPPARVPPPTASSLRPLLSSHRWEPFALEPTLPPAATPELLALARAVPAASASQRAAARVALASEGTSSSVAAHGPSLWSWSLAEAAEDAGLDGGTLPLVSLELSSTKKKRKLKMNRHKVKKRRKKNRFKNKV